MKTRAAVVYGQNQPVVIETLELDPPRQNEVLIRLSASGVCHSDLSVINGTIQFPFPAVLGHEGAGIVEDVGPGVTAVRPGDSVMLTFVSACGRCKYCTQGRPNLCAMHWGGAPRGMLFDGTTRFHKGDQFYYQFARIATMSEYTVVSENAVVPVREDTPLDKAALIGCGVTTGVGAVMNTAKVEPGSRVAVIGTGGVGLNAIQGAALVGAAQIIAVDIVPRKLEFARQFGATHTVDASQNDPVEAVRALTDGDGVDYAFEVIGNPTTIAQAFDMLASGGTAVVVGIPPRDAHVSLPAALFPYGERRVVGSMYGSARMRVDMPRLLELYRVGRLKLDELVTRVYQLEEINQAFEDMERGVNIRGVIVY